MEELKTLSQELEDFLNKTLPPKCAILEDALKARFGWIDFKVQMAVFTNQGLVCARLMDEDGYECNLRVKIKLLPNRVKGD